jgi:hypothetical protein
MSNAEYCFDECRGFCYVMLSVIMLSVIMLSVTMLIVIMLSIMTPFIRCLSVWRLTGVKGGRGIIPIQNYLAISIAE